MPKVSEINSFLGKILDGEELLSIERKERKTSHVVSHLT